MKVIEKPIEMIAHFDMEGIHPIRFKLVNNQGIEQVVKIDKIREQEKIKIAGAQILKFTCLVTIDSLQKICEIRYYISTMRWVLYKI